MGNLSKSAVAGLQQTAGQNISSFLPNRQEMSAAPAAARLLFTFFTFHLDFCHCDSPLVCNLSFSVDNTSVFRCVFTSVTKISFHFSPLKKCEAWSGTSRGSNGLVSSHPKCLIFQEVQETSGSLSFLPNRQLHSVSAIPRFYSLARLLWSWEGK